MKIFRFNRFLRNFVVPPHTHKKVKLHFLLCLWSYLCRDGGGLGGTPWAGRRVCGWAWTLRSPHLTLRCEPKHPWHFSRSITWVCAMHLHVMYVCHDLDATCLTFIPSWFISCLEVLLVYGCTLFILSMLRTEEVEYMKIIITCKLYELIA